MNEATFTNTVLKPKLQEKEFFFRKQRNTSVKGVPDSFIAKDHKGCFVEIKFIPLKTIPTHFTQWSKVIGQNMAQLITAIEYDENFLCRYIICYRVKGENYLCLIKPSKFLNTVRTIGANLEIKPVKMNLFISELEHLLQI